MTACDVAAITKPWEIQKEVNMYVMLHMHLTSTDDAYPLWAMLFVNNLLLYIMKSYILVNR